MDVGIAKGRSGWRRSSKAWILSTLLPLLAGSVSPAQGQPHSRAPIELKTSPLHSRITLRLESRPAFEFEANSQGFQLRIKGLGWMDLGAPFGHEKAFEKQFFSLSDPRLIRTIAKEDGSDWVLKGDWRYASGKHAPAEKKMEYFEFWDTERSQWILDFWQKPGPTLAQVTAERERAKRIAALKAAEEIRNRKISRQLASEAKRRTVEDVQLYCKQPLSDENSVFLKFRAFREPLDFHQWIPRTTADSSFSYLEPKGAGAARYVRTALKFYREGKFGLVLKTLDFLDSEVSPSLRDEFAAETDFLRANALLKLGIEREGIERLAQLKENHKGGIPALHSALFLAAREIMAGRSLAAVEQFQWLINHYPKHELAWIFHLGVAEGLALLKETDRAIREYQWVAENAPRKMDQAIAAMRSGDLLLDRFSFEQALAAYFSSMRNFPEEALRYPPVLINRAESLYQLAQYDSARQAYLSFLKSYPAHPAGWRATYRLGEIEGRKNDSGSHLESRKWFAATINQFPTSPGATLARIRLIPCDDHAGLTPEAQERFFQSEAKQFTGDGQVWLSNYSDFRSLAHVRALINYGKQSETVNVAIENIRIAKDPKIKQVLGAVLTSYFKKTIVAALESVGDKRADAIYDALRFYQEKAGQIPRELTPADPDYLLKLSQAAADFGLGQLAKTILDDYEQAMKPRMQADRKLASLFEPATETEATLRKSSESFSRAKALWVANRKANRDEVRKLLENVSLETPYSFEKELILGLAELDAGNRAQALKHLTQAQLLARETSIDAHRRVLSLVAEQAQSMGQIPMSIEAYRELEKSWALKEPVRTEVEMMLRNLGMPQALGLEMTLERLAQAYETQSAWGEAAATYARAAELGSNVLRSRFGMARAWLKAGDLEARKKAMAELKSIASTEVKTEKSSGGAFWKKLAQEQLENEESIQKTKEGRND